MRGSTLVYRGPVTSRRAVLGLALVCHGCTKPATPPSVEPVPPIGAKPSAPLVSAQASGMWVDMVIALIAISTRGRPTALLKA